MSAEADVDLFLSKPLTLFGLPFGPLSELDMTVYLLQRQSLGIATDCASVLEAKPRFDAHMERARCLDAGLLERFQRIEADYARIWDAGRRLIGN